MAVCAYLMARNRCIVRKMNLQKLRMRRRRKAFYRKQARERAMFVMLLTSGLLASHLTTTRMLWAKERSGHWWEQIVNISFTAHDWVTNFLVSHETFLYLCDRLQIAIERSDTIMRKAITTEKRVGMTLYFLATGADFRTIGHLFGVSKSSVCIVTKSVCAAIVRYLLPEYIQIPTGNSLKEIVLSFKNDMSFPQCAGAIDGTHIPIISPKVCQADYYNRKGWHSIILQGTVNNLGHFMDIYVGWPGRVHDARVFVNSSIFRKGEDKKLLPNWTEVIAETDVPLVLLGDPAYPLLPWLMKAFPDNGHLSAEQKLFNYRLSKARVIVEHSYGKLKGRWRCLLKRLDVDIHDVPEVVAACCVLHNVCEIHKDTFNEEWMEEVERDVCVSSPPGGVVHNQPAMDIRNALMSHFSQ